MTYIDTGLDFDELAGLWFFEAVTGRDEDNWSHMDEASKESWRQRARGERSFIPSSSSLLRNREHGGPTTVTRAMPAPQVPVHNIEISDPLVPPATLAMAKHLHPNGWTYDVRYCVGPWTKKAERIERVETIINDDGDVEEVVTTEEKIVYGQAPSVVLRFRRAGQAGFAMWLAKPWTAAGDKMKFHTAQVRPGVGKIVSNTLRDLLKAPIEDSEGR
jgi:hypothetical protein